MKKSKKAIVSGLLSLGLLAGVGVNVSATTSSIPYSKVLPIFQNDLWLASGKKDNVSQSRVRSTYVGSTYKANMYIATAEQQPTKVSGTLLGMTDGSDRRLTVDSYGVGKTVALFGENATWTATTVEISGYFNPDTN